MEGAAPNAASAATSASTATTAAAAAAAAPTTTSTSSSRKPRSRSRKKPGNKGNKDNNGHLETPRAAKEMSTILKAMNIANYDQRVVLQLLEFSHRYIRDVLDDAQCYAEHRTVGTQAIDINKEDVRLAVQSRVDFSCSGPPPREFLMEVASTRNSLPLPQVQDKLGVRLPADRYCLMNPNYTVLPAKQRPAVKSGPWDLPSSQGAIDAFLSAKENRKRRRLVEENTAPAAPLAVDQEDTNASAQVRTDTKNEDSDDYDED